MNNNDNFELVETLEVLKKYNLPNSVESFERELAAFLNDDEQNENLNIFKQRERYEHHDSYLKLIEFVESSNIYKYELRTLLYPILVYMYLDLIENDRSEDADALMTRFGPDQKFYYQDDLKIISIVTNRHQMENNDLIQTFKSNKFVLKMSQITQFRLRMFLQKSQLFIVSDIIKTYLHFDIYKGILRTNESQIDATLGGMIGTVTNPNKMAPSVLYGIFPLPKLPVTINTEITENKDDTNPTDDQSKINSRKRPRSPELNSDEEPDSSLSLTNPVSDAVPPELQDPNVPSRNRIPLPPLTDFEIMEKINEYKESLAKVVLGPKVLPSICTYTIMNSNNNVSCAKISDNLTLLAVGCVDSIIKMFSLTGETLRKLKSAEELKKIDLDECDDDEVNNDMFENTDAIMQTLIGHFGLIYSVSFSKDSISLLSCSEDKTIRLWSLQMWCCMVVYQHTSPVYDVKFSPFGYYFASASSDKTARLWATNNKKPLRIFAGHFSEVNCIQFHPNSNYVATGSSDRYVRLWDCLSGDQVRLMTGHKSPIRSLEFSLCGRFLVSAGNDTKILVWDIKFGSLVAALRGHNETVTTLSFSRCGNVLASGSLDGSLKLWDFTNIGKDIDLEDTIGLPNPSFKTDDSFLLKQYRTNRSSFMHLHFTLLNALLSANAYNGNKFYNNVECSI